MGKSKMMDKTYQVINVFADGTVMTSEELAEKGRIICPENNIEIENELSRHFNPKSIEEMHRIQRKERVSTRQEVLDKKYKNI